MDEMNIPFDLTLHHIRLTCTATTPVQFASHAGAQWRGALWEAMRGFACTDPSQQGNPAHSWHCPMCFVLALEADSPRGLNPARPLVIRPPLSIRAESETRFLPGMDFMLQLVVIGDALSVLPYLLQAVQRIGKRGIGMGRGQFTLNRVDAINPMTGYAGGIYERGAAVRMPDSPITGEQVAAYAEQLPSDRLRLHFLTPTQLVQHGRLLSRPDAQVLIMRTLERLQSLERYYRQPADQEIWKARHDMLSSAAAALHIRRDETRWIRAYSGSQRANRLQDVSGFVGGILLEGDIASLRLWLVWASLVNIGKNAIKGNGWLEIST